MSSNDHQGIAGKKSVVIVVDTGNGLLLQKREDKADIAWPGKLSHWGGSVEETDNTIEEAAMRELKEELGIDPEEYEMNKIAIKIFPLIDKDPKTDQVEAHIFLAKLNNSNRYLHVYEGEGSVVVPYDFGLDDADSSLTPSLIFALGEYRRAKDYEAET